MQISTAKGIFIITLIAIVALGVFGLLYYYWIESPASAKVPEIFNVSRVANVNITTNLNVNEAMQNAPSTCANDADCPVDSVCYTSKLCGLTPEGRQCGSELGDLKCHKKCETNDDCPSNAPTCTPTTFYIDDVSVLIRICAGS